MPTRLLCVVFVLLMLAAGASAPALARQAASGGSDAVAAFNAGVAAAGTKDLTPELFPVLAEMTAPPVKMTRRAATLMVPGDPSWDAMEGWAKSAPQQAVIEAVERAVQIRRSTS